MFVAHPALPVSHSPHTTPRIHSAAVDSKNNVYISGFSYRDFDGETIPSSLDVDYLRIANGAYHVIPEPSTLTLLIVGTLLTFVRHGRNVCGG